MTTSIGTTMLPPASVPLTGGGASPVQQSPVQSPVQVPQQAAQGYEQLGQVLQQLVTVLQSLVQALQGAGSLGAPPAVATGSGTAVQTGLSTQGTHLAGFIGTGDPQERVVLEASLAQIASTTVGASLLAQTKNAGIHMDIMSGAEFQQATAGKAPDAIAVFRSGGDRPPAILVNADMMSDPSKLTHVLAHELAHAQQHLRGESTQTYAAGIGAAASGLGPDQLDVGATLMREAGAEVIATSIVAQLQSPEAFAQVAAGRIDEVTQQSWGTVNTVAYNPNGYQLPAYVSPASLALVRQALGA